MRSQLRSVLISLSFFLFGNPASAMLGQWSTDVNKDPFNGQTTAITDFQYMDAAIVIKCVKLGVSEIRIVSPFNISSIGLNQVYGASFGVDGNVVLSATGTTVEFGDGKVGSLHTVGNHDIKKLLLALKSAKDSIALKSDLFAEVLFIPATGSTRAASQALKACFD